FGAAVVAASMPLLQPAQDKQTARSAKAPLAAAGVLLVAGLAAFVSMFQIHPEVKAQVAAATRKPVDAASEQKNWDNYGNSHDDARFAALDRINVDNVSQLAVAWTSRTGDTPQSTGAGAEAPLTPLQVGDKVFLCTP